MEDIKRSLRFPGELYERLEEIAKKERRSVAAQVIKMLEEAIAKYDTSTTP